MYNWHTSVASQDKRSSFHTWFYVQLAYKCGLTRQAVFLPHMVLCTTGIQVWPHKTSGLPSTHGFMYNWHTSVASQDKRSSFHTWLYVQLAYKCGLTRQAVFLPHMALCTTGIQVWPHKTSGLPSTHGFMYNWHTSVASQDKRSSFHTWLYVQLAYKCGLTRQAVFLPHMALCTTGIQVWPHKTSGLPSTHGFMYNWHTSVASQDKRSSFHTWLYVQLAYKCGLTRQAVLLPHMALCTTGIQVWPHKTSGLPSTHGFMYNWHTSVASQDKSSSFYTWLYLNYEQLVHKCGLTRQLVFLPYMVLFKL